MIDYFYQKVVKFPNKIEFLVRFSKCNMHEVGQILSVIGMVSGRRGREVRKKLNDVKGLIMI